MVTNLKYTFRFEMTNTFSFSGRNVASLEKVAQKLKLFNNVSLLQNTFYQAVAIKLIG